MSTLMYILSASVLLNALLVTKIIFDMNLVSTNQCNVVYSKLNIIPKSSIELYSEEENEERSYTALATASTFLGERGEGKLGWLWLLAAVDLNRQNINALYNLVNNYNQLYEKFSALSYSEIIESKVTDSNKTMLMDPDMFQTFQSYFSDMSSKIQNITLPPSCTTYAFTTSFSVWDSLQSLSGKSMNHETIISSHLNDAVYKQSVQAYEKLKLSKPHLNATDLNHELFKLQMSKLEHSSSYWGDFQDISGFQELVMSMRRAAKEFLVSHGWSEEAALRKASHPLGRYASIHI